MAAAVAIFFVLLMVAQLIAQFVVGSKLNSTRKQSNFWWVWVLCLGWIGVIIIACQSKQLTTQPQVVYVQTGQVVHGQPVYAVESPVYTEVVAQPDRP